MNNQAIKCKLCGEDFVRSYHSRKYCDSCFPQIRALQKMYSRRRLKKDYWRKWYRSGEIVVGATCMLCDELMCCGRGRKMCNDCRFRWQRKVPRSIHSELSNYSIFEPLPKHLLSWKRIIFLRNKGVYRL